MPRQRTFMMHRRQDREVFRNMSEMSDNKKKRRPADPWSCGPSPTLRPIMRPARRPLFPCPLPLPARGPLPTRLTVTPAPVPSSTRPDIAQVRELCRKLRLRRFPQCAHRFGCLHPRNRRFRRPTRRTAIVSRPIGFRLRRGHSVGRDHRRLSDLHQAHLHLYRSTLLLRGCSGKIPSPRSGIAIDRPRPTPAAACS